MSEYRVTFIVNGKNSIESLFGTLARLKPVDLDVQPLVRKGAKGPAGGESAWMALSKWVADQKRPIQPKETFAFAESIGLKKQGVYTSLSTGVKNKLIRKTAKGYEGMK